MDFVDQAFQSVKRTDFVTRDLMGDASFDAPLPIGHGQTISQPTTVRMMLEWLGSERGDKVLDVGSGSGWTSALLSNLVGDKGSVYAVERVPELLRFGRQNCTRAGITNINFFQAGTTLGLPEYAPFDRILVSAAAKSLPMVLIDQLKANGKLIIPVRNDVLEIDKISKSKFDQKVHPGFRFVPLIG